MSLGGVDVLVFEISVLALALQNDERKPRARWVHSISASERTDSIVQPATYTSDRVSRAPEIR